jgi:hypothetical protein
MITTPGFKLNTENQRRDHASKEATSLGSFTITEEYMPLPPRGTSEKIQIAVAASHKKSEDADRENFYDKLYEIEQMGKNKKEARDDESPGASLLEK